MEAVALRAAADPDALRDDDMASLWLLDVSVVMMAVDRFDVVEGVLERALVGAHERGSASRFALASNSSGDDPALRSRRGLASANEGAIGLDARPERILALQTLGHEGDARRESDRALEAAQVWGTNRAVGGALRVRALVIGGEERVGVLREAVETLGRSQARRWHARALIDLGSALRRAGQDSQAHEPLREGLEVAEHCDAIPLAETARQELAASGADVPRRISDRYALTASERRVAELTAEGASDQEIAQLFVTIRTVQDQLADAYRKLDVRSPHELGDALAGSGGRAV